MKKLLVALLGKPKLEAAISVTVAELKKVIKWAIDNDQPTKVVNKLKKIQKAKEKPALGKDTPKGTDNIIRRYPKAWQSSKELIGKPNLEAGIKAAKQKSKTIDKKKLRESMAGKIMDKKKLQESMAGKIMDMANKQIDLAYERMIKDKKQGPKEVLREQQLARAKFKKPEVPKGKVKAESFASRKEPDPKKPTMQKGGAYKGKKHSYAAGGKVNKLNF